MQSLIISFSWAIFQFLHSWSLKKSNWIFDWELSDSFMTERSMKLCALAECASLWDIMWIGSWSENWENWMLWVAFTFLRWQGCTWLMSIVWIEWHFKALLSHIRSKSQSLLTLLHSAQTPCQLPLCLLHCLIFSFSTDASSSLSV